MSYKEYSGPRITGVADYSLRSNAHLERIFWVTSYVEAGAKFGGVNMYDGCGATAGLHQSILVYPKEVAMEDFAAEDDQGSLGAMIAGMPDCHDKEVLQWAFAKEGWDLRGDGKLYYTKDRQVRLGSKLVSAKAGQQVYGAELRNTMTPTAGKVPAVGDNWKTACYWATLLHNLFKNPATYEYQVKCGLGYIEKDSRRLKIGTNSILDVVYGGSMSTPLSPELDLAMTLFFGHAVNSPATALKCLNLAAAGAKKDPKLLAPSLARILGTTSFGRWSASLGKVSRWNRTRAAMLKLNESTKFWDLKLFDYGGIIPPKF